MRRPSIRALAVVATVIALTGESGAAPITTVPTSLTPGAQYRLVFVTSTWHDATSSNIVDYNAFVDTLAEAIPQLAALGQDWKAIASTSAVDARTNTSTDPTPAGPTGVPIFLLNNTKLADSYDDMWDGTVDVAFLISELGTEIADFVWTGTNSDGNAPASVLGTAFPNVGFTNRTVGWVHTGSSLAASLSGGSTRSAVC